MLSTKIFTFLAVAATAVMAMPVVEDVSMGLEARGLKEDCEANKFV